MYRAMKQSGYMELAVFRIYPTRVGGVGMGLRDLGVWRRAPSRAPKMRRIPRKYTRIVWR